MPCEPRRGRAARAGVRLATLTALALSPSAARPETAAPPPDGPATRPLWRVPHFFEVGRQVIMSPGDAPVDTTGWVGDALDRNERGALSALASDEWRVLTYSEASPGSLAPKRYALVLPKGRSFSSNGQTVAYWEPSPDAFDFGVERSRTFGNLAALGPASAVPVLRHLEREIQPAGAGIDVQAFELAYAVEGTDTELREQKGLIPGQPVSYDRFRLESRTPARARGANRVGPVGAAGPVTFAIGLVPTDTPAWTELESLSTAGYRVLLATDAHGERYFLAAPESSKPSWYFGDVASDLVVEAAIPTLRTRESAARAPRPSVAPTSARDQPAAALLLSDLVAGTLLSGRLARGDRLAPRLEAARAFLASHDAAMADLRARGADGLAFLCHYTRTFLDSHRSRLDPRVLTALPYGDHFAPVDAPEPSRGVRHGGDQARALLGLVSYQRKTHDRSVVEDLWGLTEASIEAMTPSGAVFRGRFDDMLLAEEEDAVTGRADAFIDNGGVSVSFNHARLAVRSGAPRVAGVTWGAFSMVLDGKPESVESGDYSFAVDAGSLPEAVRADQESLGVARLFTRRDGALRVRETASVSRGVQAARVSDEIENRGAAPRVLDEVRITIADFLHHGDGRTEQAQGRYGLSAVVEGARQPVGLWMEGMNEPLWGDAFAPGWVDLTEALRTHHSRFLVVYGYDKAELYYFPQPPDRLVAYEAEEGPSGAAPYRGWTTIQARYHVGRTLAPGETQRGPAVYTTLLRAPLFSADGDMVPDSLQSLAPLWTDLVAASRDQGSEASLRAALEADPDGERGPRLAKLLHTTLEPDDASIALQAAWMAAADLLSELAAGASDPSERRELERRARLTRDSALRGATDSLTRLTALSHRADLAPTYGMASHYGFHVLVFDWAFRATGDDRFRQALLLLADRISRPERSGGLQVTDPGKPNFGGYVLNERTRAQGSNNLDDQGIKLWALRVAYERTQNPQYRRSAELFIDHWIKVRPEDHQLFGITKLFDRYLPTGPEQQMTPLGQYSLLIGLKAWADLHPRAARLYAEGLGGVTGRHPVDAIGTTGALDGVTSCGPGLVDFGTSTEVGGTFLLAMTFEPARLKGRWPPRRARGQRPSHLYAAGAAEE